MEIRGRPHKTSASGGEMGRLLLVITPIQGGFLKTSWVAVLGNFVVGL